MGTTLTNKTEQPILTTADGRHWRRFEIHTHVDLYSGGTGLVENPHYIPKAGDTLKEVRQQRYLLVVEKDGEWFAPMPPHILTLRYRLNDGDDLDNLPDDNLQKFDGE